MALWIALWPAEPGALASLGWWALQFTPRVTCLEGVIALEVQASQRLFGGPKKLLSWVRQGAAARGCLGGCAAPTAWAARAWVAVHHQRPSEPSATENTMPWHETLQPSLSWLDALPLWAMPEVAKHRDTLEPMGCAQLGDVRRLPRGGVSRRFGADLLRALDQAHGLLPETFTWLTLPDEFSARLELPGRTEQASGMLEGLDRLLPDLLTWLQARQVGAMALTLSWRHDFHRREAGPGGQCTVRLAEPSRHAARLRRLFVEHLAHVVLGGPVNDISLRADQVAPLALHSDALFAELASLSGQLLREGSAPHPSGHDKAQGAALHALLEHLSARLGAEQVRLPQLVPDHRPEHLQRWQAWSPSMLASSANNKTRSQAGHADSQQAPWPAPTWLNASPLPLSHTRTAGQAHQPLHAGRLRLLAGPHRIEAGWWDHSGTRHAPAERDYYLALSPGAGLLWVFRQRPGHAPSAPSGAEWFLHGWLA